MPPSARRTSAAIRSASSHQETNNDDKTPPIWTTIVPPGLCRAMPTQLPPVPENPLAEPSMTLLLADLVAAPNPGPRGPPLRWTSLRRPPPAATANQRKPRAPRGKLNLCPPPRVRLADATEGFVLAESAGAKTYPPASLRVRARSGRPSPEPRSDPFHRTSENRPGAKPDRTIRRRSLERAGNSRARTCLKSHHPIPWSAKMKHKNNSPMLRRREVAGRATRPASTRLGNSGNGRSFISVLAESCRLPRRPHMAYLAASCSGQLYDPISVPV